MERLGERTGLRLRIQQYLMAKYQADSPTWVERFGEAQSFKMFLDQIWQAYPQDRQDILRMVIPQVEPSEEAYREGIKREQMRRDGVVFSTDLPVGLPELHGSFATFQDRGNPTVAAALRAVQRWVSGEGPPMLTLAGQPGTGKTHLSGAAAAALVERGEDVLFRREGDLMGELRQAVGRNQVEETLTAFSTVPWLVLDDLGTAAVNDSGLLGELRDRLFDARWQAAGPWRGAARTLVTTNLLSEALPARVASRLRDARWGSPVVGIDAPDYRVEGR